MLDILFFRKKEIIIAHVYHMDTITKNCPIIQGYD